VAAVLSWERFCRGSGFNREIAVWAHPGDIASLNFAATSLVLLESGNLRSHAKAAPTIIGSSHAEVVLTRRSHDNGLRKKKPGQGPGS
jgi:hypothetical protein